MTAIGTTPTIEKAQSPSALPCKSDVNLFRYGKGVIDFDSKIANGALDLSVPKEQLHGTQVAGAAIDECRLGSAQRMRSKEAWVKPNSTNPLGDQPRILPRCHASVAVTTAGKKEFAGLFACRSAIGI